MPQGGQGVRRPGLRDAAASSAPTRRCAASTCARRCPRRSPRRSRTCSPRSRSRSSSTSRCRTSLAARATVGEFASFITAMLMLLAPLKHLTEINEPLQRGLAAAESVFGLIDTPVEEDRGTVTLGRARGELALRGRELHLPDAHRAGARRHRPAGRARRDRRAGRRLGRRQDHAGQPAAALLRADARAASCSTATTSRRSRSRACAPTSRWSARTSCCSTTSIRANIAYGAHGRRERDATSIAAAEAAHAMELHPRDAARA